MTLSIACNAIEERISPSTPTPAVPPTGTPSTTNVPEPSEPANATRPADNARPTASGLVLSVAIASTPEDIPEYDRGDWRHWTDEDGDCQNARQEVLIAQSIASVSFVTDEQCRVATGSWVGPYTGEAIDDPANLDVDHVVPLANAHRSGAWRWDPDRKRDYANSLAYDNHLLATTSSANRSKGAKGPEEWRPPLEQYWCTYAIDWATIKHQWGLTVTESEYAALSEMLGTCETAVLLQPTQGNPPVLPTPTVPIRPTPADSPDQPTDLRYDPFGPDRDCGDFDSYGEALAFYLAAGGPDSDPHRLDVNGDGEPCETLPGGPSALAVPPESQTGDGQNWARAGKAVPVFAECHSTGPFGSITGYVTFSLLMGTASNDCPPAAAQLPTESTPASIQDPDFAPFPAPATDRETIDRPTPTPSRTPHPSPPFTDYDCDDFSTWQEAQALFTAEGGPGDDPHGLDRDSDGVACQSLPGSPASAMAASDSPPASPNIPAVPGSKSTVGPEVLFDLPFDPYGPDRNCEDFATWWDAQNFYLATGGTGEDPHKLDHNADGTACETLPGAPQEEPEPPPEPEFVDRNCVDFATWREAQDFFLGQGGPNDDPHRLDRNGDGLACESLPGAPIDDPEPPTTERGSGAESTPFVDRNCSDFADWQEAQDFYLGQGGPNDDPHRLDRNGDGLACESLPGAPIDDPEPPTTERGSGAEGTAFVDRNCSDFANWQEAQDFYLSQGGPGEDRHRLDRDGDGTACESLSGAPSEDSS